MLTRKLLVSALIAAGALAAVVVPLPASAQQYYGYDRGYDRGYDHRHDNWRRHHPTRWDRDGDGIPNRYDPTPNGRRMRDSDRDGVPDRYDNYPYNPYYR